MTSASPSIFTGSFEPFAGCASVSRPFNRELISENLKLLACMASISWLVYSSSTSKLMNQLYSKEDRVYTSQRNQNDYRLLRSNSGSEKSSFIQLHSQHLHLYHRCEASGKGDSTFPE